eukprot:4912594-Heterocapsa_arctica.AAC.2
MERGGGSDFRGEGKGTKGGQQGNEEERRGGYKGGGEGKKGGRDNYRDEGKGKGDQNDGGADRNEKERLLQGHPIFASAGCMRSVGPQVDGLYKT